MRCPQCANKLLQKSASGLRVRTQGPIEFDASGRCLAKCYWCKSDVELPLIVDPQKVATRFVLRK